MEGRRPRKRPSRRSILLQLMGLGVLGMFAGLVLLESTPVVVLHAVLLLAAGAAYLALGWNRAG